MHIGIVAPEFPPDIGGVETYSYEFCRELARQGHKVTVFTRRHREGEVTIAGVRVVPTLRLRRRHDRRIIREYRMDVWHVMNAAYSWLAFETEPVFVSVHGNDFLKPYVLVARLDLDRLFSLPWVRSLLANLDKCLGRWLTYSLIHRALPRTNHVMANSRYTERVLLQHHPACRGKTSAGMVGVGEEFFKMPRVPREPSEPPHLLTVCRLSEPRKNVDVVLRALARLKERHDFMYTVVGDGHMRPWLEALARELGLDGKVQFEGVVPADEIKRLMADSDLFVLTSSVHPTNLEGFGIVYLEANACGTPVLAARFAGVVEAVEEGVSGIFVEDLNVENITSALDVFLSGKISFKSDACRVFARRFTWNRVVDHALNFYNGMDSTP